MTVSTYLAHCFFITYNHMLESFDSTVVVKRSTSSREFYFSHGRPTSPFGKLQLALTPFL